MEANNKIKVYKKFVVYQLVDLLDNNENKILCKVEFKGFTSNLFYSEEDAINALIIDEKKYQEYLIIPKFTLRDF